MLYQDFCRWCVNHRCFGSVMLNMVPVQVGDQERCEWIYTITLYPVNASVNVPKVVIESAIVSEGMEVATAAMGRLL